MVEELSFIVQTLDSLQDVHLYRKLCPNLIITDTMQSSEVRERDEKLNRIKQILHPTHSHYEDLGNALIKNGYFKLKPEAGGIPNQMIQNLAEGVESLVFHGYSPNFILMYDDSWILGYIMGTTMMPCSGNAPIGDWYIFYVDAYTKGYKPGPPHRSSFFICPHPLIHSSTHPFTHCK